MLKKFGISAIIITLLIISFFVLTFTTITKGIGHNTETINLPSNDSSFGNLFFYSHIDDSLPYAKYKIIDDIHKTFIQRREQINNSPRISGWSFLNVGLYSGEFETKNYDELPANFSTESIIATLNDLDTYKRLAEKEKDPFAQRIIQENIDSKKKSLQFNPFDFQNENSQTKENYFSLGEFDFKENDTKFFIKNGSYNLAKVKWQQNDKNLKNKIGSYYVEKINFRYSSKDKRILIPVSGKTFIFLKIFLAVIFGLTGFAMIYFFIGIPIQILLNISRGDAFSLININYLKEITKFTIALLILSPIISYLLPFILIENIYANFTLSTPDSILKICKYVFFIFALVITRKAFIKGYNLEKENALTV
ncbi:MAG: DUF2975 domain-containing protein [Ferruginibacter sp.]|nr:DUF2975 domain-containing protein [Ferruginibacter sp.]